MEPPPNNEPGQSGNTFDVTSTPTSDARPKPPQPIPEGRRADAGRGLAWIGDAWQMFKDAPGSWVACFLIFLLIMFVLALIPLLGNIAGALLSPVLIGGIMIGCRELERSEELTVAHLFAGFREKSGPLLTLGLLEFAISLVVMLVAAAIIFATVGAMFLGVLMGQSLDAGAILQPGFWLGALVLMLVIVALFIPVSMAVWFAPALVALDDVNPLTALKWSFFACLKNMWSFLVYGLVMLGLAIVATIPLGLGWLLLGPVIMASVYTAYRDIFFAELKTPTV
jgi:uncharacterized membrane protein